MIKLENEKLIFDKNDCPFTPGDSIAIQYEQKENKIYPIIGLIEKLGAERGNKLLKSFSMNIKGQNYAFLAAIGTEFAYENYGDCIYKLIPLNEGIQVEIEQIDFNNEILEDTNFDIQLINKIL